MQQLRTLEGDEPDQDHTADDEDDLLLARLGGSEIGFLGHQGFAPAATVPLADGVVDVDVSRRRRRLRAMNVYASTVTVALTFGKTSCCRAR